MTDRELLEMAARTAGIQLADEVDSYLPGSRALWVVGPGGRDAIWNPLNDDGDALRLLVSLDMLVDSSVLGNWTEVVVGGQYITEGHGVDAMAATRRAIVRAAASMGETRA